MKLFYFFFIRALIVFILSFVSFSQLRKYFFKKNRIKSKGAREFFLCIFAGYLAVLAVLLFTPNSYIANYGLDLTNEHFDFVGNFKDRIDAGNWGVNLVPFRTMKSYIKYSGFFHSLTNIFGNILIFVPLGILLPILYKNYKKITKVLIHAILLSLFIESIQFFIGRSVDIDDLILNSLGALGGYFIYKKLPTKIKNLAL